jgi:hypothetical protein
MMTRKDYVFTADVINDMYHFSHATDKELENMALAFAEYFENDNDRFDRKIFFKACYREKD